MSNHAVTLERRRHRRTPLALPIRLRWPGPFGQCVEVRKTLDVSRGGALVEARCSFTSGASLWVTFPFDPALPDGSSEFPARVVWAVPGGSGSRVAIAFEVAGHITAVNGNRLHRANEHRSSLRRTLSIPVRVRLCALPWYEDAMTLDFSADGLRFLSTRLYEPGNHLCVSFMNQSFPSPWAARPEVPALVVRVEPLAGSNQVAVALCRLS
jgi:PilZ domain